jgi:hypothetical protein
MTFEIKRFKNSSKHTEFLYYIYQKSYKKYRYWLSTYYILVVISIIVSISSQDIKIFFEKSKIMSNQKVLDKMEDELPDKFWKSDTTLIGYLSNPLIRYPRSPHPFVFNDDEEGNFIRRLDTTYNFLITNNDSIEYKITLFTDSIKKILTKLLPIYNGRFAEEKTNNKHKKPKEIAGELRLELISVMNDTIRTLFNYFIKPDAQNNFLNKYPISGEYLNKTPKVIKKDIELKVSRLNKLYDTKIFKAPYIESN